MTADSSPKKSILTISSSHHITGEPVEAVLAHEWCSDKVPAHISNRFDNVGFNLEHNDVSKTLSELRKELRGRKWDAVLLGWCVRGHAEYTVLFEKVIGVVVEELRREGEGGKLGETKLIFGTGPENLVEATARNFP